MRCLYIVAHDPITPNYKGSSAVYYEHLASLSELGHEIHLWHYADEDNRREFNDVIADEPMVWSQVENMCSSINLTTFDSAAPWSSYLYHRVIKWWSGIQQPHPIERSVLLPQLLQLVEKIKPHLIWAQHFESTRLALMQKQVPVVFSHLDWLYRIKALRKSKKEDLSLQLAEEAVVRQAQGIVSGSKVECQQLRAVGGRNVFYIPTAYEAISFNVLEPPSPDVRLVHLGGLSATSNRIGLERFFDVVWPELATDKLAFYVIGDVSKASPSLATRLASVKCTGFVPDLSAVLRPYDIHVIPWEFDTGQRTRLPVAFNFAQAVLATRASIGGFPEASHNGNCYLVDRLEDMVPVIRFLLENPGERVRLGRAARQTFENNFVRSVLLSRYEAVVNETLKLI